MASQPFHLDYQTVDDLQRLWADADQMFQELYGELATLQAEVVDGSTSTPTSIPQVILQRDGVDGDDGLPGIPGAMGPVGPQGLMVPGRDGDDGEDKWIVLLSQSSSSGGGGGAAMNIVATRVMLGI